MRLGFTPLAEQDLVSIADYIATDNPRRAASFVRELRQQCERIKRNPTGRMATPEEVAAATVFLASPRSAFTTGINMLVDGAISTRVNY